MNRTQETSRGPPMNFLDRKRGGAVSSRSFDLLNSMMHDPKRSVDLRWLFDTVLNSSLHDLVSILWNDKVLWWWMITMPMMTLSVRITIKKFRNGDTLGPEELNVWPEQANQGDGVNRMTRVRYLSSYLEWLSHQDFKNIAYVGFFKYFVCVLVFVVSLSLSLSLYLCPLMIFE